MGNITSTITTCRSGSGTIKLTHSSFSTLNNAFDVSSMGSLSYQEVEDSEEKASSVYLNLGEFSFSCFDKLSNGGSLFGLIDGLSSTDKVTVTLNYTISSSNRTFNDVFTFNKKDITYDSIKREISIGAQQTGIDSLDTNLQLFLFTGAGAPTNLHEDYSGSGSVTGCVSCKDFIDYALDFINPLATFNVNYSLSFAEFNDKSVGDIHYVIPSRSHTTDWTKDITAKTILLQMAAIDGGVIASVMGYNFFVHRGRIYGRSYGVSQGQTTYNQQVSTVTDDDVKSISIKPSSNAYYSTKLVFTGSANYAYEPKGEFSSAYSLVGSGEGLNSEASKTLDIFFTNESISRATFDDNISGTGIEAYVENALSNPLLETDVYASSNAEKGFTRVLVDNGSGGNASIQLSNGDVIEFSGNLGTFYEVDSQTSTQVRLKEPLRSNVGNDERIVKVSAGDSIIAEKAIEVYNKAFGASGSREIEISIFGIDSVKPYQPIKLDGNFDYPVALRGKLFRPKTYEVDLVNDIINVTAYEI